MSEQRSIKIPIKFNLGEPAEPKVSLEAHNQPLESELFSIAGHLSLRHRRRLAEHFIHWANQLMRSIAIGEGDPVWKEERVTKEQRNN